MSKKEFINNYDQMILNSGMRTFYGDSGFYNVGLWHDGGETVEEACSTMVNRFIKNLENKKISKGLMLDVGCGLGANTTQFMHHFGELDIIGLNVSRQQLKFAHQKNPKLNLCTMDAVQLGFPDNSIDCIVSIEAAFHFSTRLKFFHEAKRVLKSGGNLLLTDILFYDTSYVGDWSVPLENNVRSISEYTNICLDCGFEVNAIDDITLDSWYPFCDYLGEQQGNVAFTSKLKKSVAAYIMVDLSLK